MEWVAAAQEELRDRVVPALVRDGLSRVSLPGELRGRVLPPPETRRWRIHHHSAPEVCCFLRGSSAVCVREQWIEFTAPHLLVLTPNVLHGSGRRSPPIRASLRPSDVPSRFWAAFYPFGAIVDLSQQVGDSVRATPCCIVSEHRLWEAVLALLEELTQRPEGYGCVAHGLVIEIVGRLARAVVIPELKPTALVSEALSSLHPSHALVSDVKDFLNRHYYRPLTLSDIADALHVSTSRLTHDFKPDAGRSVMAYLTEVRIAAAKSLLQLPLPIITVASLAGFQDPAYFGRVFRSAVGVSPSEFRKRQP